MDGKRTTGAGWWCAEVVCVQRACDIVFVVRVCYFLLGIKKHTHTQPQCVIVAVICGPPGWRLGSDARARPVSRASVCLLSVVVLVLGSWAGPSRHPLFIFLIINFTLA